MLVGAPLLAMATAAEPGDVVAARRRGAPETAIIGGLGAMGGDDVSGLAFNAMLSHRYDLFEVGVELDAAALFSSMVGASGVVGLHLGDDVSLRILVAGGVHHYEAVGRTLLSDDPGVSGSLPFLGQRLLLGYSFGRKTWRNRAFVGLLAAVDVDSGKQTQSVTYTHQDWLFGDNQYEETATHSIGQISVWGLVMAGVELDLLPY